MAQNFRDLIAWQKAMKLAKNIYGDCESFPRHQLFGLTQQLQRAAVSVPSNIAEGHARHSSKDFLRFLSMARGSLAEVQTQLLLAHDLGYLAKHSLDSILEESTEVYKLINGLYSAIGKRVNMDAVSAPNEALSAKH
jgi:four helix bundle protein